MADYEDEDEDEVQDSDFVDEEGEAATCIIQQVIIQPKNSDITQRHQIFYSRCSVKNKVYNLIIDKGNCENIILTALVNYLNLETKPHAHQYTIGWIKKGPCRKVTNLCYVLISIGKFYQCSVTCDVVDMYACQILLGRPWQYDVMLHIEARGTSICSP